MYGKAEHWPLRDLALGSRPPPNRAFWTQGLLSVVTRERIRLCVPDEVLCIELDRPVPEIRDTFFEAARSRDGELATLTGVRDEGLGFMFWAFESGPMPERRASGNRPAIGDVVRDPGRFAGRDVTLEGCFRGERWPEAQESARPSGQGWVLSDGPFHVWIMGRQARGKGWSLESADAHRGFMVEATGKVQRSGDGVYVGAKSVRLLKRNEVRCP
jgi:hypothetical protein